MRMGAVGICDALGFKGVWRRVDKADRILDELKQVKRTALNKANLLARTVRRRFLPSLPVDAIRSEVRFFSDSIVITSWVEADGDPAAELLAIPTVAVMLAAVTRWAADSPLPFGYRGCLSFGDFLSDDEFNRDVCSSHPVPPRFR